MCRLPSCPPGVWRMPVSDGGSMNPEAGIVVSGCWAQVRGALPCGPHGEVAEWLKAAPC
jgi:hypothetical protein